MRVGVAEARLHWRDLLDRVRAGERVEITRHGNVVAVLAPPPAADVEPLGDLVADWRRRWATPSWSGVRDTAAGRDAPW
jgi:prevent-host-death family protein